MTGLRKPENHFRVGVGVGVGPWRVAPYQSIQPCIAVETLGDVPPLWSWPSAGRPPWIVANWLPAPAPGTCMVPLDMIHKSG